MAEISPEKLGHQVLEAVFEAGRNDGRLASIRIDHGHIDSGMSVAYILVVSEPVNLMIMNYLESVGSRLDDQDE